MPKKLSDSEILSLLSSDLKAGVRYADTKLASERRKVEDYYNGKLPAPFHAGNSRYVSTDVFDSVESAKATLLETFSAHGDIVQFAPRGEKDVPLAQVATAYTKHVVFEQNAGTELFGQIIHGGLTHRNAVAKVFWDHSVEQIDEEFNDMSDDELDAMLADETVTLNEITQSDTGFWHGSIARREDRSQVRIEAIPMEELVVPPNIKSLTTATLISHRQETTKDELKRQGFDPLKVNKLPDAVDDDLELDAERRNRFIEIDDGFIDEGVQTQDGNRKLVVHETYARINADKTRTKLWKIVHCSGIILDMEEVLRHPFLSYAPLATPHRFWGENFAARVIPTQNAKTVLLRSILDHAVIANNPRYGVVKGALTNPRELLDNRLGGLVNVTRPDGVFPLPQAPLNPFVFQTIGMLDEDKEDVTGVSRLSQGMNKDAISNQNSQGMVEKLIGASMQRQKTMARAFAAQFLGPLFLEVYRLVVENETRERIVEIAGNWVPCTPSDWERQRDVTIDFRLGYGEREQRATEYLQIGQILGQDQAIAHLYTATERYNVYRAALEAKGHRGISMFLKDPTSTQPPPPDPMMTAEVQLKQQALQINDAKQKLAEQKHVDEHGIEQFKADMEKRFDTLTYAIKAHEQERKTAETNNRIAVSQGELALAVEAERKVDPANEKATAIISPNG
jgi:hypothetical protein